jgi:hypothetical protein
MLRILPKLGAAMVAVCASALPSQAATITAASTAQKDVATAVASAQDGDTVQIPAGDSTWSSGLTITKAITLHGQGISNTFLRRHEGLLTFQTANKPVRVTGIYFDMTSFDRRLPNRSGIRIFGTNNSFRIDRCYFNCGERSVSIEGDIFGVIDHCTFRDSNLAIYFAGANQGARAWANPYTPGTINTMVVEDCTVLNDLPGSPFVDSELYGQDGGLATIRHNTIDYTGTDAPCIPVDAHGWNAGWGHSTRFYEIYQNTFKCRTTYNFIALRGGAHLVHDNTFIVSGSSTPMTFWMQREHSDPTIPAAELIKNTFIWNNTLSVGGGAPVIVGGQDSGQTKNEPVPNVDFFNRNLESSDIWHPHTPLVYPHPRVTAEDGGKPSPIANLRVTASGS